MFVSIVTCNDASAFSNLTILSVISSTICFCSTLNVFNSFVSELGTCTGHEPYLPQYSVMKFDSNINMWLFPAPILQFAKCSGVTPSMTSNCLKMGGLLVKSQAIHLHPHS